MIFVIRAAVHYHAHPRPRAKPGSPCSIAGRASNLRVRVSCRLLLEKGVDPRYIRELPGHESGKNPDYTHITKKGRDKIKNPPDDLDI